VGLGVATLVADPPSIRALLPLLRDALAPGERVLVVRPEGPPSALAAALRQDGASVDEVGAYRNVPSSVVGEVASSVIAGAFDVVIFTAPSTLRRLLEESGRLAPALSAALSALRIVAIGPTTAEAIAEAGLSVAAVAATPAEPEIVAAVLGAVG
jgi:uroporphyrinogen-III synthase